MLTISGNYTGKTIKTFKIIPKETKITGFTVKSKSKVQVRWKKQNTQIDGYEIEYSTSKKFTKKTTKTICVKKKNTSSTIISKLKPEKNYYIRIRTYKKVKINGKIQKMYSDWSDVPYKIFH